MNHITTLAQNHASGSIRKSNLLRPKESGWWPKTAAPLGKMHILLTHK